jgi:hypothetical protein
MTSSLAAAWRRTALITAAAAAVYAGYLLLPSGHRLSHLDFLVTGPGSLQFCDAVNPRFLPVVEARSPVAMALTASPAASAGRPARVDLALRTASGKPIGPDDLLSVDGRKIQLLIVDPALEELHQEVARPAGSPGRWRFSFTPAGPGPYRVFADFTPQATGKEMYVSADLPVGPGTAVRAGEPAPFSGRFELRASARVISARQPVSFTVTWADGSPVAVSPLEGAWGRLTVVDADRKGLAFVHPPAAPGERLGSPVFKVTLSDPGPYRAWATINWSGRTAVVPLRFSVQP